ncbi:MAG: hypothetical protein ACNI27_02075 [Desulfovibrio sp.]
MRLKFLFCMMAVMMLAACAPKWTNPNIADPRTEDTIREETVAFCQNWSMEQVPVAGRNSPRLEADIPLVMQDNVKQYNIEDRRDQAFDRCMRNKGWVPVQED